MPMWAMMEVTEEEMMAEDEEVKNQGKSGVGEGS